MPTQSAVGLCTAGLWHRCAGGDVAGEWSVLSFVWSSCHILGVWDMSQKIGGIYLSITEYALVSEVHKE